MAIPYTTTSELDPERKRPIETIDAHLLEFFRKDSHWYGLTVEGSYYQCVEDGPYQWRYTVESPAKDGPEGALVRMELITKVPREGWTPDSITLNRVD